MDRLKREAERLRIGIQGGWLPISDAVAWADQAIAAAETPDASLIEIAFASKRSRTEMAGLLRAVPGSADTVAVMRAWLTHLLRTIQRDPDAARQIAGWLASSVAEGNLPEEEFGFAAHGLTDAFHLADHTVGTHQEAADRVVAFLRAHAERGASGPETRPPEPPRRRGSLAALVALLVVFLTPLAVVIYLEVSRPADPASSSPLTRIALFLLVAVLLGSLGVRARGPRARVSFPGPRVPDSWITTGLFLGWLASFAAAAWFLIRASLGPAQDDLGNASVFAVIGSVMLWTWRRRRWLRRNAASKDP